MSPNSDQASIPRVEFARGRPARADSAGGVGDGNFSLDDILSVVEKQEIVAALRRNHMQRTLAARSLSVSRSRLYRRMGALGINPRNVNPGEID